MLNEQNTMLRCTYDKGANLGGGGTVGSGMPEIEKV
jgi:hypothetical protein